MTYYGLGLGPFPSGGPGERSVPTSSYGKRIRRAHSEHIKLVGVDEWGTTKYCSQTLTELAPAWRRVNCDDGAIKYRMDRDVKLCTSQSFPLESHSFLIASQHLLNGLIPYTGIPLDRDKNAAFAIRQLTGVANDARPSVYKRS